MSGQLLDCSSGTHATAPRVDIMDIMAKQINQCDLRGAMNAVEELKKKEKERTNEQPKRKEALTYVHPHQVKARGRVEHTEQARLCTTNK